MKTSKVTIVSTLVLVAVGGFYLAKRTLETAGIKQARSTAPTALSSTKGEQQTQAAQSRRIEKTAIEPRPARVLKREEFAAKFGLTQIGYFKMQSGMHALYDQLTERKGLEARVEAFDGKNLKMTIPGLKISDDELTKLLATGLSESLELEKVLEILADDEGRATLENLIGLRTFKRDVHYSFARVREENDPARNLHLGYAAFDVSWGVDNTPDGSANWYVYPAQVYHGFTYADIDSIRMGWNAMAKAPQGYFRSEPIEGIASKPKGDYPAVIRDLATGKVEVLGLRHPGSVDTIEVPRS